MKIVTSLKSARLFVLTKDWRTIMTDVFFVCWQMPLECEMTWYVKMWWVKMRQVNKWHGEVSDETCCSHQMRHLAVSQHLAVMDVTFHLTNVLDRCYHGKRLAVHSKYVCCLGIEPMTLSFLEQCPTRWATGDRNSCYSSTLVPSTAINNLEFS